MFKDFVRRHFAVIVVTGISLAISLLLSGGDLTQWAEARGRR